MLIPFSEVLETYNIKTKGVIHVGANFGQEAKDYYDNGVEDVVWIEANPKSMETLYSHLSQFPKQNPLLVLNKCVSEKDGDEVTFNISNNEGQSSSFLDLEYHKIAHQEVFYTESITLTTTTLNTLFKDFELTDYKFLNADIQGAELLMLKGATEILPKLDCLYLEVNEKELYKGCGLIGDIDDFVSKYGFKRARTEWCGNFGWGDAVYIKNK
jgi:FkbM family methyltransferase